MRLAIFPNTFRTRRIGLHAGLALVVAAALLLGAFVLEAAAHQSSGVHYRGGVGIGHVRTSWSSGPRRYRRSYHGPRVRVFAPIHRHYRPRLLIRLGSGFSPPRYYRRPVVVERRHYIIRDDDDVTRREPAPTRDDHGVRGRPSPFEDDFDVTNEPPPGCYYHDGFCDREFSTLDDYTEHLQDRRHSETIDIIDRRSGDRLHTLEFVNGEWGPRISD
jgi:hypothetical protein